MMRCPSCGTQNNYYHHFCYFCGNDLSLAKENIDSDETSGGFHPIYDTRKEQKQPPLKRYVKEQSVRFGLNYLRFFSFIFVVAIIIYGVVFLSQYLDDLLPAVRLHDETLTASASVESTIADGIPAQRILVRTNTGEIVEILGRRVPVSDGIAEIIFENAYLQSRFPAAEVTNGINIDLEVIVYREGVPAYKENLIFEMIMPPAPLTLIQPQGGRANVIGENFRLVFSVSAGSAVFINGDNFTDLVDETGRFHKDLPVPDTLQSTYEIRVSKRGYKDSIVNVELLRETKPVPLSIEQPQPITTETDTATIEGLTQPGASITTDFEIVGDLALDSETGAFSMQVSSELPGMTAGTITSVSLDGLVSNIEVTVFRVTSEDVYTRIAWKPDLDALLANPALHAGQIFLFVGAITEVLHYGDKNTFVINAAEEGADLVPVFVEYWGAFDFQPGDSIRVFGNRWGNHNGMIRVLAPFIYDR